MGKKLLESLISKKMTSNLINVNRIIIKNKKKNTHDCFTNKMGLL